MGIICVGDGKFLMDESNYEKVLNNFQYKTNYEEDRILNAIRGKGEMKDEIKKDFIPRIADTVFGILIGAGLCLLAKCFGFL